MVDWLGIIYELVYIPLIFPANWLLDNYGLMPVALFGSFGNAAGAIIKVPRPFSPFSEEPGRALEVGSARAGLFWLTFVGQLVAAASQVFVLGIPAALAGAWFGPGEVSKATALGVFGNQVGNTLGFLLPPLFVPRPEPWDEAFVARRLQIMFITVAAVTTALFVLVVAGSAALRTSFWPIISLVGQCSRGPPSCRRARPRHSRGEIGKTIYGASGTFSGSGISSFSSCPTVSVLLEQANSCLLQYKICFSGMCVGTFYAISTLLNQTILSYYPVLPLPSLV